jgi:hypothetical protein
MDFFLLIWRWLSRGWGRGRREFSRGEKAGRFCLLLLPNSFGLRVLGIGFVWGLGFVLGVFGRSIYFTTTALQFF